MPGSMELWAWFQTTTTTTKETGMRSWGRIDALKLTSWRSKYKRIWGWNLKFHQNSAVGI